MNVDCYFELTELETAKGKYLVRLSFDNFESTSAESPFEGDLSDESPLFDFVDKIENGNCEEDDLKEIGVRLWDGLVAGDVKRRVLTTNAKH